MKASSFVLVASVIGFAGCAHESAPTLLPMSDAAHSAGTRSAGSYKTLHNFNAGTDAQFPQARLTAHNGLLYGTAPYGGAYGIGAVFEISTSGTEHIVHNFKYVDGATPISGMRFISGAWYGTTSQGGAHGQGTVFRMTPSGTITVLHSFNGGTDGAEPIGDLINWNGTIYGTTFAAGGNFGSHCYAPPAPIGPVEKNHGCGTIFKVTASGQESRVASFDNPAGPLSDLTPQKGMLYGTTYGGPDTFCQGTVYSLDSSGHVVVIHDFGKQFGCKPDGGAPVGDLIVDNGVFYGTTYEGGKSSNCAGGGAVQCGAVFSITLSGSEKVIHSFGKGADGIWPTAGLTPLHGLFYGVTSSGGTGEYGNCGILFSITPSGHETILHDFAGGTQDGCSPLGGLVALNGTLYGTTVTNGLYDAGTVFAFTP